MCAWVVIIPRLLLVLLFLPFSALDKVLNFKDAVDQASQAASAPWLARMLILAGLATEVVMCTAILMGIADRLAAFVMAGYCVLTALLWKQFWKLPDFRLKGASSARGTFWDFLKNSSLAGGFLLLVIGSNGSGTQEFIRHPLESSHLYDAPIRACSRGE